MLPPLPPPPTWKAVLGAMAASASPAAEATVVVTALDMVSGNLV